jgi:deoxyribonuclease V
MTDFYNRIHQARESLLAIGSIEEALVLQAKLAPQVVTKGQRMHIDRIAGVDVAYEREGNRLVAGVVMLDADTLRVLEMVTHVDVVRFPYIPGLFSFRELPPVLAALAKLSAPPEMLVCDGHGLAHPRRFGLACHLGLATQIPTLGCAKTPLLPIIHQPSLSRGSWSSIELNDQVVGAVVRTQERVAPVYVSPGHKISVDQAREVVLHLAPHYRLPETTRLVNTLVEEHLKGVIEGDVEAPDPAWMMML